MILTKQKTKEFAKAIDEIVDWVKITGKPILGRILEAVDNWILPNGIEYLDTKLGDKIPVKFWDEINEMVDCFISKDYEGVLAVCPKVIDQIVNIEALSDDIESKFITTNFKAVVEFIEFYAKKNK